MISFAASGQQCGLFTIDHAHLIQTRWDWIAVPTLDAYLSTPRCIARPPSTQPPTPAVSHQKILSLPFHSLISANCPMASSSRYNNHRSAQNKSQKQTEESSLSELLMMAAAGAGALYAGYKVASAMQGSARSSGSAPYRHAPQSSSRVGAGQHRQAWRGSSPAGL